MESCENISNSREKARDAQYSVSGCPKDMEVAEVAEGLNEWEQIQSPWHQSFSATASAGGGSRTTTQSRGWHDGSVVVIRDNYLHGHESSIFPPSSHEGLPVPSQDNQHPKEPPQEYSSPSSWSESTSSEGEEVGPLRAGGGNGWRLRSQLRLLSSGIIRVAYAVRNYAVCRGGLWSFVCVSGVLVVSLLYEKVRRRRRRFRQENEDRLIFLVREKEQKINQLLLQIAQMNEVLSARHSVPVVRIR